MSIPLPLFDAPAPAVAPARLKGPAQERYLDGLNRDHLALSSSER